MFPTKGLLVRLCISVVLPSTYIVPHITLPRAAKGFACKNLTFFHLCLIATFHNRDGLPTVNRVLANAVAVQVSNALDGISRAVEINFVALHSLLYRSTNITHANVYSCFSNTGICSIFDSGKQIVVHGIESVGPRRVQDPTIDMHPEIHFHDIFLPQDPRLACRVGRVMCCTVVDVQPCRKAHPTFNVVTFFEARVTCQGPDGLFDSFSYLM